MEAGTLISASHVRAAALTALLGVAGTLSPANANTVAVITIDVESNKSYGLPEQVDAVCTDGSACSLMEIARMLERRGRAGTFFINVYEHAIWGEAAMRNIAARLQGAGQDLALHTHPETAFDRSRTQMYEYSLQEQTEIIREGVRLLTSWTGQPVVAHRAGDYAADRFTLLALERNGVLLDSSYFWRHPSVRLDGLGLARNLPSVFGAVTEVPVTVYSREDRPAIIGAALASVPVVRKIDVDWFVETGEMKAAVDAVVAAKIPVLVIFLHSFSLLSDRSNGEPLRPDRHSSEMFGAILDYLNTQAIPVVTMRDLAGRTFPSPSPEMDIVPAVTVHVDWPRYVWRRAKTSKSFASVIGGVVTLLVGCTALILVRKKGPWLRRLS
jgi:peptidoglycan/xylan/chitin deacetylase (PgdA/CDA1 family)